MKSASLWRNALVIFLLALMLLLAVPAKEASAAGCAPVYYTIRCGDTLSSIAARFGVSVWQLARLNGIPNPNRIFAGQTLVIYGGCCYSCGPSYGTVYIVRCGDTLWRIARMYGTTPWAIAQANGIYNLNYIRVGQRLVIP